MPNPDDLSPIYKKCSFCDQVNCICEKFENMPCFCDACEYNKVFPNYISNLLNDCNYNFIYSKYIMEDIERNAIIYSISEPIHVLEKWLEHNLLDSSIYYIVSENIYQGAYKNYDLIVQTLRSIYKKLYKYDYVEYEEVNEIKVVIENLIVKLDQEFYKHLSLKRQKIFEKELIEKTWHPTRVFNWCIPIDEEV